MQAALKVPRDICKVLEQACSYPISDVGRGETIFDEEVIFQDGNRMAIQVVTSLEPEKEPAWTQGVLFAPNGTELGFTECGDSFIDEYIVWYNNTEYSVIVSEG